MPVVKCLWLRASPLTPRVSIFPADSSSSSARHQVGLVGLVLCQTSNVPPGWRRKGQAPSRPDKNDPNDPSLQRRRSLVRPRANGLASSLYDPLLIITGERSLSNGYLNATTLVPVLIIPLNFSRGSDSAGCLAEVVKNPFFDIENLVFTAVNIARQPNISLPTLSTAAPLFYPSDLWPPACTSVCGSLFQPPPIAKTPLSIPPLRCFHSGAGVMSKRFQTQSLSKGPC